jgi:hypothetical protein
MEIKTDFNIEDNAYSVVLESKYKHLSCKKCNGKGYVKLKKINKITKKPEVNYCPLCDGGKTVYRCVGKNLFVRPIKIRQILVTKNGLFYSDGNLKKHFSENVFPSMNKARKEILEFKKTKDWKQILKENKKYERSKGY